jgi:NitT/TauT family transport system permease protein
MSQVPAEVATQQVLTDQHEDQPVRRNRLASYLRSAFPLLLIAIAWQTASHFSKPYLFPGLDSILADAWKILTTWDLLVQGLITWARLLGSISLSLLIGIPIGLAMGLSRSADEFFRPIVKFIMGIPALNWVIIVIIWFSQTELRIGFVLVMLCTPITIFCVYDGVRSIDGKLTDMVQSFGASRIQQIKLLMWPYVKAFAFTAAKLNIGNAVRTVIVAELVGAPFGIGKELDLAKNLFDMSTVLAWTLLMVMMAMTMTHGIEVLERIMLRWRGSAHEPR